MLTQDQRQERFERASKESHYLKESRRVFNQLKNSYELSLPTDMKPQDYLELRWYEGKHILQVLQGSYEQFVDFCTHRGEFGVWTGYYRFDRRPRGYGWYDRHGVYWREGLRYRRQPHHAPKEKSARQAAREDWREHRRTKQDKSRRRGYKYNRGAGRFSKNKIHRRNRQWTRLCIYLEAYEEITQSVQDVVREWWD